MKVARSYTDNELLHALKHAQTLDDAVRFMYANYYKVIAYYVTTNNGSNDDVADVFQETVVAFIEIVEKDKFRGEASIQSLLYTLARNIWLGELRKKNSREKRNTLFEKEQEVLTQDASHHLVYHEHQKAITKLFEQLGDTCKRLLLLVYYEDLSMKDVLQQMPDYQNEQVLRNKKYKCMKQLETLITANPTLKTEFKNALKYGR